MKRDPRELSRLCWVGLPGPELDGPTSALLRRYPPSGVVLFRRNVSDQARQIADLIARLQEISLAETGAEMVISIDQEGGPVKRLPPPFGQYPSAIEVAGGGEAAVFDWGVRQGQELKALGITMNLAPVLDVNTLGPRGVMRERSYGSDPATVTRLGLAAIGGLRQSGVAACAKHFPGIGHSTDDSHQVRPVVERSLDQLHQVELPPFAAAVAAGVEAVMVGHLVYPALDPDNPASLSPAVIAGLLKGEMGYGGQVLVDDLDMGAITNHLDPAEAARRALAAGADRLLFCRNLKAFETFVTGG